ncbi:TetR/AcrR family transcriptional regulator [[Mycobacterium] wendilense]|uniref:TetR/AcrR family transcriptional regulator n=1 Tax=[Mycobacterium] wendilense TaxID=3064284 RepID=A0ABM9MGJ7_9MYCO|nr:TetR/AcrR family transcriptional regulator [Mycolicibacterium sp. MU0050]
MTALELVEESGGADFTVQALIDRSNLSLRAFYQHFASKDELLLALYDNLAVQFTKRIRDEVDAADGPMEKLEAFCREFLSRSGSANTPGGRVVTIQNLSLKIDRSDDRSDIWEPHRRLLTKIITSCSRAGLIRKDLNPAQLTTLLNSTLSALAQTGTSASDGKGTELTEDQLWAWCRQALMPAEGAKLTAARAAKATGRPAASRRTRS